MIVDLCGAAYLAEVGKRRISKKCVVHQSQRSFFTAIKNSEIYSLYERTVTIAKIKKEETFADYIL